MEIVLTQNENNKYILEIRKPLITPCLLDRPIKNEVINILII